MQKRTPSKGCAFIFSKWPLSAIACHSYLGAMLGRLRDILAVGNRAAYAIPTAVLGEEETRMDIGINMICMVMGGACFDGYTLHAGQA